MVVAAGADGEILLVGGGSNLLVCDEGFAGTAVLVRTSGVQVTREESCVTIKVAAGEPWDEFVALAVAQGWAGVETLSGIPGSVGATPIQNVGAYGADVSGLIVAVRVLDRETGQVCNLATPDLDFGYRTSLLKRESDRWVVVDVTFRLETAAASAPIRYSELARKLGVEVGDRVPLLEAREAVLDLRRGKGMVLDAGDHDTWSAGSFFTNPIVNQEQLELLPSDAPRFPQADHRFKTSAAWLITQAGFERGYRVSADRRASLSTKHSLALTNRGGASAHDLLELARAVQDGVQAQFGILLENEPVLVGCRI